VPARGVLERAAETIRRRQGEVVAIRADVTKPGDVQALFADVIHRFARVDILVNNAGTSSAGAFEDASDADWQGDLDLKVFAAIRCARLALPHMRRLGGGRIINITHVGGKQPGARSVPTSVSRAAGIALTKALSKEFAKENVLVNTICVGKIKSGQWERRYERAKPGVPIDEWYASQAGELPLGRFGEAEEWRLITYLASAVPATLRAPPSTWTVAPRSRLVSGNRRFVQRG